MDLSEIVKGVEKSLTKAEKEEIRSISSSLLQMPTIQHGQIHSVMGDTLPAVHVAFSQLEKGREKKTTFSSTVYPHPGGPTHGYVPSGTPSEWKDIVHVFPSTSGGLFAVFHEDVSISIFHGLCCIEKYALKDVHGGFYVDETLSSFEWSEDESLLLYVAELARKEDPNAKEGKDYAWKSDWGEQMEGKKDSRVFVLDRVTKKAYCVPCEEVLSPGTATLERFSTGQACFTPDFKGVVYCKFRAFPSQLGITYCNNRPSELKLGLLRDLYDARSAYRKERVAELRRQGIDDDRLHDTESVEDFEMSPLDLVLQSSRMASNFLTKRNTARSSSADVDEDDQSKSEEQKALELSFGAGLFAQAKQLVFCLSSLLNLYDISSPAFAQDGRTLLFMYTDISGGTHWSCMGLKKVSWDMLVQAVVASSVEEDVFEGVVKETLVGIVQEPEQGAFPGMYRRRLPQRSLAMNSSFVVTDTPWYSEGWCVVCISLLDGTVTRLTEGGAEGSCKVLDVWEDFVLIVRTSLDRPGPIVELLKLAFESESVLSVCNSVVVVPYFSSITREVALSIQQKIGFEILTMEPKEYTDDCKAPVEAILVYRKRISSVSSFSEESGNAQSPLQALLDDPFAPLVVIPHGGPHSVFTTEFNPLTMALVLSGFSVLLVNYRGSIGFGQRPIHTLPGKCNMRDVSDILLALDTCLSMGIGSEGSLGVLGGSYGGCLSLQLIAHQPSRFSCCTARNPVTNIATLWGQTDIPDWCLSVSGLPPYPPIPTLAMHHVERMMDVSPIAYVEDVETPTAFFLGGKDKRCPLAQGLEYHKALCRLGVSTEAYVFPNSNHTLMDVADEGVDAMVLMISWLKRHMD